MVGCHTLSNAREFDEVLAVVLAVLLEEEQKGKEDCDSKYGINRKRNNPPSLCEFHALFPDLIEDAEKLF